ncbi:hypothetical protein ASF41_13005 [Methylobacterium sp. Leaf111]|uniref:integrase family protein n=1 Tax=Methylobacterium sp. Leaf111 TaxID=1736257 RepID=UPI0006F994D1|nr:integrase family protein [Methylobacterium sp. Leaf111]KQP51102.1 hypothetical protein ASF41_13005 [Methylobacterium sp. Leaf111]
MGKTTGRGSYTREKVRMTAATVDRAAAMIQDGALTGRGAEILDTATPGLTLRVTRAAGTWYLRHRKATIRLGSIETLNLPAARAAAIKVRGDVELGIDPKPDVAMFERIVVRGDSLAHAVDVAFPEYLEEQSDEDRRRRGPWEVRDLVDEFMTAKAPKLKPSYVPLYERYLRYEELDPIARTPVANLTLAQLESARDRIIEAHAVSAAARTVAQMKEALTWAKKNHATKAGFKQGAHSWWKEEWNIEYSAGTRTHEPTVAEIARTLVLAERHRSLANTEQQTGVGMLAALWAVALTAQRTGALTQLRRDGVIPWEGHPGWQVWTWTAKMMKGGKAGGRPHGLPIPPAAVEAMSRFETDPDSEWMFPSRAGGKRVTPVGLNQLFYRLQGKMKAGKGGAMTERAGGNLLHANDIRTWTPHDTRRTIASFLLDEELGGVGSAILAHSRGKNEPEEAKIEDITRRVYANAQRLPLKAKGMEIWVDRLLAAYERERAAMDRVKVY